MTILYDPTTSPSSLPLLHGAFSGSQAPVEVQVHRCQGYNSCIQPCLWVKYKVLLPNVNGILDLFLIFIFNHLCLLFAVLLRRLVDWLESKYVQVFKLTAPLWRSIIKKYFLSWYKIHVFGFVKTRSTYKFLRRPAPLLRSRCWDRSLYWASPPRGKKCWFWSFLV